MDEQQVQLVCEARTAVDAMHARFGTASVFMSTEPLAGWRRVTARPSGPW